MQELSDMCVLLSLVRQGRLFSHAADCRQRGYMSTFRGGRAQNERVRPGHTWREPGGSTNLSLSDSVRLEPGRDKSASEVATTLCPLGPMQAKKIVIILQFASNHIQAYIYREGENSNLFW